MKNLTQSPDLDALKRDYDRDGYISITPYFGAAEMDEINAALDAYVADVVPGLPPERAFYEQKGEKGTLKQAFKLEEESAFFRAMLEEGPLREMASAMFGEPALPKGVEYFNKPPGVGKPTPPHQDGYYFHLKPCVALTCWLALEPVDDENGCIHYVRGSHKAVQASDGFRPHGRSEILGFSQGVKDFGTPDDVANTVSCPGPAGTLLMHDARTIHWAEANRSATRSRRALGLVYWGESARRDQASADAYRARLEAEMKERGQI